MTVTQPFREKLARVGSAVVVQAALDSRAACTTTAGPVVIKPFDEIKI